MKFVIRALVSKICWENSSFIKIRQEQRVVYINTFSHLWQYFAELFLEWRMFQIRVVEIIKIHILCRIKFFENRAVCGIMSKDLMEPERPQMTIWRRVACWISKTTRTEAQARAVLPHTYTYACTRTHSRSHTHTQICNTHCLSTATMVSWTSPSVALYVHWLSC